MAEPSRFRNFVGRGVDRILSGSNYNPQTGQYSNIGGGILGTVGRVGAGIGTTFLTGNPMLGKFAANRVGRVADTLVDGGSVSDAARAAVTPNPNGFLGQMFSGGNAGPLPPNMQQMRAPGYSPGMNVGNIGFGGFQTPSLNGYTGSVGQGSMDAAISRGIQSGHDALASRAQTKLDSGFNAHVPGGGGWMAGSGGARGAFSTGGYANADARAASIAATQQALQAARAATPNNRQMNNYAV